MAKQDKKEKPTLVAEPPKAFEPMRAARMLPSFGHLLGSIEPAAYKVPSMMSMVEKRVLFNLARKHYSGEGVIIDAGIFLGGSTVCFGEGIRANAHARAIKRAWDKPVIAFEKAIIGNRMPEFFDRNNVTGMGAPGESFADALRENIAAVADLVDLRIGDIMETARGVDHPVEILFLDVLKLPDISKFMIRQFFTRLIPGVSIVVHQDYFYELLPYIMTDQEFFRDYFTFIGEACSTALFLCTKAIPLEAIEQLEAGLSADEQERLVSIALQRSTDPARRFMVALAKTRLINQLQGEDAAYDYLCHVRREFPEQATSPLPRLRQALQAVEKLCAGGR